jgi:glutamate/tyrosine decarboxylase-like PLP-dependent enzyme
MERDRERGVSPLAVVAAAGSPTTGAADPLPAIADICERHGAWLHVDAAFGGFFRLCPRTAALVEGIERADSVAVDGHKWLNLPTGTGFAFLRDPELHRATFTGSAGYLTRPLDAGVDMHELGVEASRPWRSAAAWAALASLGRSGAAELVSRCCDLAAELGRIIRRTPRLELVAPVASCVVCFRYRPEGMPDGEELDRLNRETQACLTAEGRVLATGGTVAGGFCLRPAIVSWRTTLDDVAFLAAEVRRIGDAIAG